MFHVQQYSGWNGGKELIVKIIKDDQDDIDLSKLKMSDVNFKENKSLKDLFKKRKIRIKSGENF